MDHGFQSDKQRDLYDLKMLENVQSGAVTREFALEQAEKKGFPKTLRWCKEFARREAERLKKEAAAAQAAAKKAEEEAAKAEKASK